MLNSLQEQLSLIEDINNSCRLFFSESTFFLRPSKTNRFMLTGSYSSSAINNHGNTSEEINVIKWFDDLWIYIEIKFENQNTFISLSVFQGVDSDCVKHQLFRAEWDDYNNDEEKHPQPHWHITSNQGIEKTFVELASLDDADTFVNLLKEEKSKLIDVSKIHFAMNGNWINNESEIHSLDDKPKIINWFNGLFAHLKVQLEYVK